MTEALASLAGVLIAGGLLGVEVWVVAIGILGGLPAGADHDASLCRGRAAPGGLRSRVRGGCRADRCHAPVGSLSVNPVREVVAGGPGLIEHVFHLQAPDAPGHVAPGPRHLITRAAFHGGMSRFPTPSRRAS
jgi:hypothetical protein